jgi:hypothetical protein
MAAGWSCDLFQAIAHVDVGQSRRCLSPSRRVACLLPFLRADPAMSGRQSYAPWIAQTSAVAPRLSRSPRDQVCRLPSRLLFKDAAAMNSETRHCVTTNYPSYPVQRRRQRPTGTKVAPPPRHITLADQWRTIDGDVPTDAQMARSSRRYDPNHVRLRIQSARRRANWIRRRERPVVATFVVLVIACFAFSIVVWWHLLH